MSGATGFVGRYLVPNLVRNGYEILEISRNLDKSLKINGSLTKKILVSDPDFKTKIYLFKPEIVIHLASYITPSDEFEEINELIQSNIYFFSKILDAVSKTNLKIFINTGTFAEYFNGDDKFKPAYLYAATKTASRVILDYYSAAYEFKQTTVVPYTIYGGKDSREKIIDIIYNSSKKIKEINLSPGNQVLDFIHINDVIDFYITLIKNIDKLKNKSEFKLGTGIGHSLKDLAKLIEEICNVKPKINWGGIEYRKLDVMYAVADTKINKNTLNWSSKISLREGLQNYFK